METYKFQYKKFTLNPLYKHWRIKFQVIRDLPVKVLRELYKHYYKDSWHRYDCESMYYKIAYAYQKQALDLRRRPLSDRLKERTNLFMNAGPSDVSVLVERILGVKLKGGGGDSMTAKKTEKKARMSIASMVYDLIKKGLTDEKIIEKVKKAFPKSKINKVHMNWYRHQLAKGKKAKTEDKEEVASKKKSKVEKIDEDLDEDEEVEDETEEEEEEEEEDEE